MIDGNLEGLDMFCGAGGMTTAALRAGVRVRIAINHSRVAIRTHEANHPGTRHVCAEMEHVEPDHRIPDFNILFAGVSCTDHSNAKGSATVSDQKRSDAWYVHKFAQARRPPWILVENVREFLDWCRTKVKLQDGQPVWNKKIQGYERIRDLRYRGEYFRAWTAAMEMLGYRWEYRLLNAADHGAAQSRLRLFILFRLQVTGVRNQRIPWPEPTHGKQGGLLTIDEPSGIVRCKQLQPWRGAWEIIDFNKPIASVFGRRTKTGKLKPLVPKTLKRLEVGLIKFNAPQLTDLLWQPEPATRETNAFLAVLKGTSTVARIHLPLPTITAGARHHGLAIPYVAPYHSGRDASRLRRGGSLIDMPLPTLDTQPRFGLAMPFLMQGIGPGLNDPSYQAVWSIDSPVRTLLSRNTMGIVQPYTIDLAHSRDVDRSYCLSRPLGTVTTCESMCLAVPYLVPNFGERPRQRGRTHGVYASLPTVTGHGAGQLAMPFLLPRPGQFDHWQIKRCRSIGEPLNTVIAHHATAYLAQPRPIWKVNFTNLHTLRNSLYRQPFIIDVNHGDGGGRSAGGRVFACWQPLTTVCGKRHHGLLLPFYGTGVADPLDEPLSTVTTKDRHGLALFDDVLPAMSRGGRPLIILNAAEARLLSVMLLLGIGELGFRMLAIDELLQAQGFPADYVLFGTNEEQVKQVGNAVERHVGTALFAAIGEEHALTEVAA